MTIRLIVWEKPCPGLGSQDYRPAHERILRVFPRRTSFTPTDELAVVGEPGLFVPDHIEQLHVSCTFTWDQPAAFHLAKLWEERLGLPAQLGGPALRHPGAPVGEFNPGLYVKAGITFTSRGCPKCCPWCQVRDIEGDFREVPIRPGWIVQDNNLLAASDAHFDRVCEMLSGQRHAAKFSGGLDVDRLDPFRVRRLEQLRIEEAFIASDGPTVTGRLLRAAGLLRGFLPQRKVRCYVLVGFFPDDTPAKAEQRLEWIYEAGCLPFPQLYHSATAGQRNRSAEWRDLMRRWRPAAAVSRHKQPAQTPEPLHA